MENEQTGNIEADNISTETTDNTTENAQVTDDVTENQTNDTEQTNDEVIEKTAEQTTEEPLKDETTTEPAKIKVGDREFTQEELTKYYEENEAKKTENEYKPRDLETVETELNRAKTNVEADVLTLQKKFIAKATTPTFNAQDDDGNITVQSVGYTPDEAYQYGMNTGDWNAFLSCLSPQDAITFQTETQKLFNDYTEKFNKLSYEKQFIEHQTKKTESNQQWDAFIETVKDNPAEKFLLDNLKKGYLFDKEKVNEFLNMYRKARALEQNSNLLNSENEAMKDAMQNNTINKQIKQNSKIFTREEIGKMTADEFAKNEAEIDRQLNAGLIK